MQSKVEIFSVVLMARVKAKNKESESLSQKSKEGAMEVKGFLLISLMLLLLVSLLSFQQEAPDKNLLGIVGYFSAFGILYTFGLVSYPLIGFALYAGYRTLIKQPLQQLTSKAFLVFLFTFSACILLSLLSDTPYLNKLDSFLTFETAFRDGPYPTKAPRIYFGGFFAYYLYQELPYFSLKILLTNVGTFLTMFLSMSLSLILLFNLSIVNAYNRIKERLICWKEFLWTKEEEIEEDSPSFPSFRKEFEQEEFIDVEIEDLQGSELVKKKAFPKLKVPLITDQSVETTTNIQDKSANKVVEKGAKKGTKVATQNGTYELPPLNLLTHAKKVDQPSLKRDLQRQANILEETLLSFGIEAKVGQINCGPTITSFEVHPAIGVKVQKIKALENDIALNLQAKSIRIIAPIPGKAAVGVEIPSPYPQEVGFKEMLTYYKSTPKKFLIPVLLGKSVSGDEVMCDLAKMPHCLIAGATGSGKSVCINTIIMSILMNASPDEIKLILVDPKKVELTPFSNLPHLIAPVITEPNGAYAALKWIVQEMQLRYEILKQLGVRNITAFNNRKQDLKLEESLSIPIPEKMFQIVAIIDEFADLMMSTNADLETPIARIAQMARAVGIHLVLATQRPSREVITGLIKANFPTRIAFKVASRINSQIILDENGAEALLGNGDMLFLPPGTSQLMRAQGVYIRDEDINRVVSFITDQQPSNYLIQSFDTLSEDPLFADNDEDGGTDTLYQRAVEIVTQHNNASTTFLQRKLKIGYARAASLIDELELRGVVSPQDGSKARKVLLKSDF